MPEWRTQASEGEKVVRGVTESQMVKHLTRRGKELGDGITGHQQSTVGSQMVPILLKCLACHDVTFAQGQRSGSEGGRTHGVHGNDYVVFLFRSVDKAAAIFGHQPDLGLLEKPTPMLGHAFGND